MSLVSSSECVVCYDDEEEDTFPLSCCSKQIHLQCFEQWKKTKENKGEEVFCPHCRQRLQEREQTELYFSSSFRSRMRVIWGERPFWMEEGQGWFGEIYSIQTGRIEMVYFGWKVEDEILARMRVEVDDKDPDQRFRDIVEYEFWLR